MQRIASPRLQRQNKTLATVKKRAQHKKKTAALSQQSFKETFGQQSYPKRGALQFQQVGEFSEPFCYSVATGGAAYSERHKTAENSRADSRFGVFHHITLFGL